MYDRPFHEGEVASRTDPFAAVARVFSTCESPVGSRDADPVMRGVNSVQLVRARGRWWIAQIAWDVEGPGRSIPADHLPGRR